MSSPKPCEITPQALYAKRHQVLDQGFDLAALGADLVLRPFILVGFVALLLLVPLALTSTKRSVTALGYVAWSRLHRVVHLVGVLGVLHFYMRVKKDTSLPAVFALVLGVLLAVRLLAAYQKRRIRRIRERIGPGAT